MKEYIKKTKARYIYKTELAREIEKFLGSSGYRLTGGCVEDATGIVHIALDTRGAATTGTLGAKLKQHLETFGIRQLILDGIVY